MRRRQVLSMTCPVVHSSGVHPDACCPLERSMTWQASGRTQPRMHEIKAVPGIRERRCTRSRRPQLQCAVCVVPAASRQSTSDSNLTWERTRWCLLVFRRFQRLELGESLVHLTSLITHISVLFRNLRMLLRAQVPCCHGPPKRRRVELRWLCLARTRGPGFSTAQQLVL